MKAKTLINQFIIAVLYSIGIVLPLLAAFGMSNAFFTGIAISVLSLTIMFLFKLGKKFKFTAIGILIAIGVYLLVSGTGAKLIFHWIQMFKAFVLYFNGARAALIIYSNYFAIIIALFSALLSFAISDQEGDFMAMAMFVITIMFISYQVSNEAELIYTLPSWLAVLITAIDKSKKLDLKANIIVIVITILSFILLPMFTSKTLKPLNDLAKNVTQQVLDHLFFTEEREVFSLENYGYYPDGPNKFGGKVELSKEAVMTVKTDKKVLLRGVTKDFYTGYNFLSTKGSKRYLFINPRWLGLRQKVLVENLPPKNIRENSSLLKTKQLEIQMYRNSPTTLFAPAYIRKISAQGDMVPYFNEAGELFITRNLVPGDTYTVTAPIVEGGEPGLENLVKSVRNKDPYYNEIYEQYTQLPQHIENAMYALRDKIVSQDAAPYNKAYAIMTYLRQRYGYTLDVDEIPENTDFVTYFLLASKEGYCVHFASAMTVLARMSGLPARYVEGFIAQPDGDGIARVTGLNAHAWCEVYFENFGWIPFDPTAPRLGNTGNNRNNQNNPEPTPTPTPPNEEEQPDNQEEENDDTPPEPSPSPSPSPEPSPQSPPMDEEHTPPVGNQDNNSLWLILLILLLIALIVAYIYYMQPENRAKRAKTQKDKVFIYASAIFTLIKLYGRKTPKIKADETIYEYALKVEDMQILPLSIIGFASSLNKAAYSKNSDLDIELNHTSAVYKNLTKALPWFKKPFAYILPVLKPYNFNNNKKLKRLKLKNKQQLKKIKINKQK
ncbi:MAG: hypothetical protein GYA87_06970 [Christensenellaceae bacterium]|nr:hypothetical protein [Christensenellaceae bacterium]